MSHVKIELATPSDDKALRSLQSRMSMPGLYRISYLRDPSFFKALNVEGRFHQTIIGRDLENGTIVGWGNRSIKPAYVNGSCMNIGYLSGLRMLRNYNNVFPLFRGYKKLQQLHQDGKTQFYLTTILNKNIQARKILTSRQRGLPQYHTYGELHCKAISLAQATFKEKCSKIKLREATKGDLDDILKFLHKEGGSKQFYPYYRADDFFLPEGLLAGLAIEDIILAFRGNQIVGVVAAWNQQSFRASQVAGYGSWLTAGRIVYNFWAWLSRRPRLPKPGTKLNYFYLALIAVKDDEYDVFKNMLNGLMLKNRGRYDFMLAGFHTSHPLIPVLRKLKGNDYLSQFYLVSWDDGEKAISSLDDRPVYLEVGAL